MSTSKYFTKVEHPQPRIRNVTSHTLCRERKGSSRPQTSHEEKCFLLGAGHDTKKERGYAEADKFLLRNTIVG